MVRKSPHGARLLVQSLGCLVRCSGWGGGGNRATLSCRLGQRSTALAACKSNPFECVCLLAPPAGDIEHLTVRLHPRTGDLIGVWFNAHRPRDGCWVPAREVGAAWAQQGMGMASERLQGSAACLPAWSLTLCTDLCRSSSLLCAAATTDSCPASSPHLT